MEPRIFTSLLLFISSYSPLAFMIAIKDFDFENVGNFEHPFAIYIILTIAVMSIVLLFISLTVLKKGNMSVKIVSVKNRSVDLINYTVPYILSFIGLDLSKYGEIISFLVFMLLMFVLTVTSHSIFFNPVLALLGYKLYDVEYECGENVSETSMLCADDLRKNDKYFIRQLTRFTYLAKVKINNNYECSGN